MAKILVAFRGNYNRHSILTALKTFYEVYAAREIADAQQEIRTEDIKLVIVGLTFDIDHDGAVWARELHDLKRKVILLIDRDYDSIPESKPPKENCLASSHDYSELMAKVAVLLAN